MRTNIYLALMLAMLGACNSPESNCRTRCQELGQIVESFEGKVCKCVQAPRWRLFCEICADACQGQKHGVKLCKEGHNTWGAGPDVCECQAEALQ